MAGKLEGVQLGNCRLLKRIGSGGMGEVYLAEQMPLERQVAVKVLRGTGGVFAAEPDAEALELFTREARAVAALDHPYILPLYDFGEQDGIAFLIMPYMPEGSLADLIAPGASQRLRLPLPPALVCELLRQVSSALQFAHEHGVIHRDVKPGNLLVRQFPRDDALDTLTTDPTQAQVVLADFGIARFLDDPTGTTSGTGTPQYSAPEQLIGHPVPASDQYALACLAYLLLTGSHAFTGSIAELHHQHLAIAPILPTSVNAALPSAVDAVLARALAKEPGQRYENVVDFAQALQQAVQLGHVTPRLSAPLRTPAQAASVSPESETEPQTPESAALAGYGGAMQVTPGDIASPAGSRKPAPPPALLPGQHNATPPAPAMTPARDRSGAEDGKPAPLPVAGSETPAILAKPETPEIPETSTSSTLPEKSDLRATPLPWPATTRQIGQVRRLLLLGLAAAVVLAALLGVLATLPALKGSPLGQITHVINNIGGTNATPSGTSSSTTTSQSGSKTPGTNSTTSGNQPGTTPGTTGGGPGATATAGATASPTATRVPPTATPVPTVPPLVGFTSPHGHYATRYPSTYGVNSSYFGAFEEYDDYYYGPNYAFFEANLEKGIFSLDSDSQLVSAQDVDSFVTGSPALTFISSGQQMIGGVSCARADYTYNDAGTRHLVAFGCHANGRVYDMQFSAAVGDYPTQSLVALAPILANWQWLT